MLTKVVKYICIDICGATAATFNLLQNGYTLGTN